AHDGQHEQRARQSQPQKPQEDATEQHREDAAEQSHPQTSDGDEQQQQQRSDEDGGSRRRRSRRERRRSKGSAPQPSQQQRGRDDDGVEPGEVRRGVLDVLPEGYGFIRTSGYLPGEKDVYVSQGQIRKHALRRGDLVEGPIRVQRQNEKVPGLHHVGSVNGADVDQNAPAPHRRDFKDMTPLFPDERLGLETPDGPISMRIIDLMAPIGKGQRGLIVSPPKAGKTTILKELGQAIARNNPEVHLMVVLVDERPEEVTDMQRSIPGEVIASTFDRPADDHTQIAELAIERAKRLVETGGDVVVLLDSITRLSRAYNLAAPASGRIMSGGVDSSALYPPKRFFGAARNIEGGGSLTIIASALIETGSKMDEVIFEEFKGTGNMELRLDRRLEQKRIFPAIDLESSGTRKEELLIDSEELAIVWKLRRVLHALEGPAALELLIDKMKATRSNNQFLVQIQKSNLST
ncbi:MAG: transcription termination factor Rho, partial [Nitriliruptorales bacterium]|nr:transcription termination factor Rho [Nitriliruptorales bacterium]